MMGGGEALRSWGAFQAEDLASAKALRVAKEQVTWRREWWAASEGCMGQMVPIRPHSQHKDLGGLLQDFEPKSGITWSMLKILKHP